MIKSDKTITGLFEDYEKIFAGTKWITKKYLEIGIKDGGSLEWAKNYFTEAMIFGIDIKLPAVCPPGIVMAEINQNNSKGLIEFAKQYGEFDIIVDDGSHMKKETENTFNCLFPYLKKYGVYIIEDWGAGYLFDWGSGMEKLVADLVWKYGGRIVKNDKGGTYAAIFKK